MVIAELWRAKRACGAPWVSKSTHPRRFGNHVTVHRPPARCPSVRSTGIPMFTLTLSSYFWSPGESWLHINVVINGQLSKQGIRWSVSPYRIAGSGVDPSRSSIFWSYPLTIYSFHKGLGSLSFNTSLLANNILEWGWIMCLSYEWLLWQAALFLNFLSKHLGLNVKWKITSCKGIIFSTV